MKYFVRQNRWGNWRGYAGGKFVKEFPSEQPFMISGSGQEQVSPGGCMPSKATEWLEQMNKSEMRIVRKGGNELSRIKKQLAKTREALEWMVSLFDDEGNLDERYPDQASVALEKADRALKEDK